MTATLATSTGVLSPSTMAARTVAAFANRVWPAALLFVAVLLLWEAAVVVFGVSSFVIAKPSEIVAELFVGWGVLGPATWVTAVEVIVGFLISVVVGIVLALMIVRFEWVERAAYPLIVLFQVVPKVALAPIFILWFGYSMVPKLVLIVVMAFFPITINMVLGLKRIDEDHLLLMRSVGSTRNQILLQVQLPMSLPNLFAGIRIAITLAVIGAVVAEFAGSQDGLGYQIQFASTQLDTPMMFAALVVVSVLGLLCYYAIDLAELIVARAFPHIRTTETN